MSFDRRRSMIDAQHPRLSLVRQCELVSISRGSVYYKRKGESVFNLELMRLVDEQYLKTPWYGARQMARHLRRHGYGVGRKRIRRLMRLMNLKAIAPGPQTSRRNPAHKVYPYLLRDRLIRYANEVWCADLTYIPLAHGFVYVVAAVDHPGYAVLSGSARRGDGTPRQAAHLQYGPGQSVHQQCVDRCVTESRYPYLDGRQGQLDRQRVHRALVALDEVRVRLLECIR